MYGCRTCGYRAPKWLGRCPGCASWGSIEEREAPASGAEPSAPRPFSEIDSAGARSAPTGIGELDRVLGGGLVPGAVILLAGEPGIGKSTLLLQAASRVAERQGLVLYVSGEESAAQLRGRGERLGVRSERLLVSTDTDVDVALAQARAADLALLAIDSVQALRCADLPSVPGSATQVRETSVRLVDFAKATAVPVVLVGHVTKEGAIAGPRSLEHLVDTVIHFEGDRRHEHRVLRALKNRFGPVDEIGVFRMSVAGLVGVDNPSELFLTERAEEVSGSAVLAAVEGTRPLLVEIQALVGEPAQGSPRRTCLGVEPARLALVLAVLERRVGLDLAARDVFVKVTGGIGVGEPAVDLAVAAAVASSSRRQPVARGRIAFGEIGLTGEVRAVGRTEARLREAVRLGFSSAIIPGGKPAGAVDGICCRPVSRIEQAIDALFD